VKNQIVTIHDTAVLEHSEWFNPQFAAWYRFLIPRLATRVRRIIAVSHYTKARISEICSIPEYKIKVVQNGVGPEFTPTSQQQITFTKESLGIPGVQYILALGTVEPRKNIDRLIRAWGQVVESIPDNIWLVVGGGKGPRRIFGRMHKYSLPPRVFFCGFVPNEMLPALYSGAMITTYPSLYEGFGLPALEAMACGCPVLTSNTTALPEIVRDAAILVNPYDCEAIAYGLLKLIVDEELRVKLRRLGLKRAKNFSWKRAANETFKILREESSSYS
jgi:glycosyltransferase involved in cell wall biosynthesis